jgi:hypothetical protein
MTAASFATSAGASSARPANSAASVGQSRQYLGVLKSQCLSRRIADWHALVREIAAWESARNAESARIRWMFTVDKARSKMRRSYPEVGGVSRAA